MNTDARWVKYISILLAFGYLVSLLVIFGGLALQAWPDNPLRQRLYVTEAERLAALEVTGSSLRSVENALSVVSRLPATNNDDQPSRGDISLLQIQLVEADSLIFSSRITVPINPSNWNDKELAAARNILQEALQFLKSEQQSKIDSFAKEIADIKKAIDLVHSLPQARGQKATPKPEDISSIQNQLAAAENLAKKHLISIPANPLGWNKQNAEDAKERLSKAHQLLEARAPALLLSTLEPKPFVVIKRTFLPPPSVKLTPPLTSSEQREVAQLMSDMYQKNKGASSSPLDAKLRPLLAGLQDTDFIVLLVALGAWGACAQALASLVVYIGERKYEPNWWLSYIARPFIGGTLAFAFYVILRGGLMTRDASWEDINHVGYAAIAVLVGFCSNEAMENLREVAAAFFRGKSKVQGLASERPKINELLWDDNDALTISGDGFQVGCAVLVDGQPAAALPKRINDKKLSLNVLLSSIPAGSSLYIVNPQPNGTISDPFNVPVHPNKPIIAAVTEAGDPKIAPRRITIRGHRFGPTASLWINGAPSNKVTLMHRDEQTLVATIPDDLMKRGTQFQVLTTGVAALLSPPFSLPKELESSSPDIELPPSNI